MLMHAALFLLISIEAISAYALAEALRLRFLRRWSRTPPLWRLAWGVGATVYAVNLACLIGEQTGMPPIGTPTSHLGATEAILAYPLIAMAVWAMIIVSRREVLRAHGRDPYAS
ncbi:MAG TPA: hypothetical protein VEL07_07270 [Planctomycetota bacterium]|nr:hypothetical protein [Planctomycetota bacterium]